jgi:hyperosmotically inducible protein
MTTRNFLFACLAALLSSPAYAQTSVNSPGIAASAVIYNSSTDDAGSKKARRAENRRFSRAVQHAIYGDRTVGDAEVLVFGNAATGKVVLVGYVYDPIQGRAAVSAARQVEGVTDVTSELMVQEHNH